MTSAAQRRNVAGSIVKEHGAYLVQILPTDSDRGNEEPLYYAAASATMARRLVRRGLDELGWQGAVRYEPSKNSDDITFVTAESPPLREWNDETERWEDPS